MKITKDKEFKRYASLELIGEINKEEGYLHCQLPFVIPIKSQILIKTGLFIQASKTELIFITPRPNLIVDGISMPITIVLPGEKRPVICSLVNVSDGQINIPENIILADINSIDVGKQSAVKEEIETGDEGKK